MASKKIILAISTFILLVGIFIIYFFLPKTVENCGSALPMSCRACECSRGIPMRDIGSSGISCLGGEVRNCENL